MLGPFFGETPETYFAHHVGMHHPENNLDEDLSSTLPYQRDQLLGLHAVLLRFFFGGIFELTRYFARKKRRSLDGPVPRRRDRVLRCVVGAVRLRRLARRRSVVFIVPFVVTRFAMMAGNWAQHAFIDEAAPENNYRNSITCINCDLQPPLLQRRLPHRPSPEADAPLDGDAGGVHANLGRLRAEEAIVFAGDRLLRRVVLLMLQRYDSLARRIVNLGEDAPVDGGHRRAPPEPNAVEAQRGLTRPALVDADQR